MTETYTVRTTPYRETDVNAIHEDRLAQRVGFDAGPVPGVLLFGYLTYLPVKARGEQWLTQYRAEVRFLKPAYIGQTIDCTYAEADGGLHTQCANADGVVLATLESEPARSDPNPLSALEAVGGATERPVLDWAALVLNEPASVHTWLADTAGQARHLEELGDGQDLYGGVAGCVHPFWIMKEGNAAFKNAYVLPPTIHVGSELTFHTPLRVGEQIETRLVPMAKWERKGHKFVTLYISYHVQDEVRVEMAHTFIINIADTQQEAGGR